jgi:hypothetical protein
MKRFALISLVALSVAAIVVSVYSISAQQGVWGDMMPCVSGEYRPCGIDTGECKRGVRECEDGDWGDCKNAVMPVEEICANDKDDDCNGIVDDCIDNTLAYISIAVGVGILIFAFVLSRLRVHEKEDEF